MHEREREREEEQGEQHTETTRGREREREKRDDGKSSQRQAIADSMSGNTLTLPSSSFSVNFRMPVTMRSFRSLSWVNLGGLVTTLSLISMPRASRASARKSTAVSYFRSTSKLSERDNGAVGRNRTHDIFGRGAPLPHVADCNAYSHHIFCKLELVPLSCRPLLNFCHTVLPLIILSSPISVAPTPHVKQRLARPHWGKMNWATDKYLATVYPEFDSFNVRA